MAVPPAVREARAQVRRGRVRVTAQVVAVAALLLAVADGFRWGNRWFVAARLADAGQQDAMIAHAHAHAHGALVRGLALLLVAVAAAVVGWRLRVVVRR